MAVHVLVSALWSAAAGWVLTGLSLYGGLWVIADWRALSRRPIELAADRLELRVGLRWELTIPLDRVVALRRLHRPSKERHGLNAAVFGPPTFELELAEPMIATGVYGIRRRVDVVRFQVDEPDRFERLFGACQRV